MYSGNGNIHVQTNQNGDNPELENRKWYPREKPTLSGTTAIDDEITAQPDTNHDNADADARQPNTTSEKLHRGAHAKNQTTATMEETKPCHSRTNEYWANGTKEQRHHPYAKKNTNRTYPIHRSAPRNA